MNKVTELLLVFILSILVGGLLTTLHLFEGAAPKGLLSALNWAMAFCGMVFFISLCGCLFVSEQTRRRRFGLWMGALGCFGVFKVLSDWLKPGEDIECGGRLLDYSTCFVISHLPMSLQGPAWFVILLLLLLGLSFFTALGWKMYVDER